ncbi:MAG: hypothetical protein IPM82_21225 [Saprospiraceae bacterium]|nr:hypothetical protein [Saprospiraceae bacterium]
MIAGTVVLCAVVLAVLFGEAWLERIIRHKVEEKIAASPNFKCGEIALVLRPGSLIFKDAVIDLDLVAEGRHLEAKSTEIALDGIDWFQIIFFKKLKINKLHVESPFVMLSDMPKPDSLSIEKKPPSKGISSIQIAHLNLERGRFKIVKQPKDTLSSMTADTFDINIDGLSFKIDKKGASPAVKKLNLDIRDLTLHSNDNLHDIALNRLLLNKEDNSITLTGLTVKPKFSKKDFFKHVKKKQGRLDFDFPEIVFRDWQFNQLTQGKFVARTVLVNDMKLQVLANQNIPIAPNHYEPLPHEALLKAALGVTVDSILVKNGQLEFENIAVGKTKPGLMNFTALGAVFTNVTNDTARIRKQPMMTVEIVGDFQNKHRIYNNFWMDLSSPDYAFSFKGGASTIPFSQFNAILTPSTNIVFDKGRITKMTFEANADKSVAKGKLSLDYDDLGFHFLNKKKEKSKFLSELADMLFIKNQNNANDADFQKGIIYMRRETDRPFFRYWWFAIQSGLMTSILSDFELKSILKIKERQMSK